jgi:putative oxidoreductase
MKTQLEAIKRYLQSEQFARRREAVLALIVRGNRALDQLRCADFLPPLLIRLYLVPVLWMAAVNKFGHFQATAEWFGGSLGLPLPYLMAFLAATAELLGAIFLLVGFAVRWISVPLLVTMAVAAVTVHWQYGWLAIASATGPFATERTIAATERLAQAKEVLARCGNYESLTEYGSFVVLNNGIEFAATYLILLLVLLMTGGGRYVSADYWLSRRGRDQQTE